MINYVRLELYKKGKGHIFRAFIPVLMASIISSSIFIMINFLAKFDISRMIEYAGETTAIQAEIDELLASTTDFQMLSQIVGSIFIVFTGVMYANYIVADFKSGMIEQMYLYPIKKQNIIISKILSAALLGFIGVVLTFVFGSIAIKLLRSETNLSLTIVLDMLLSSVTAIAVALIPMIIGMGRKSVVWTIVLSVLLATTLLGNWGSFTLANYPVVSYILAIIAVAGTIVTIQKLAKKDCLK